VAETETECIVKWQQQALKMRIVAIGILSTFLNTYLAALAISCTVLIDLPVQEVTQHPRYKAWYNVRSCFMR
jgi:hypothetical protein